MAETVEERIAARKAIADERMKEQGPIGQFFNRIGLIAADSVDRVESPFQNVFGAFASGAADGAMQGALWGAVAWGAVAALTFGTAAAVTAAAALPFVAVGATVIGLWHGAKKAMVYEDHKYDERAPDTIAQKLGAAPTVVSAKDRQEEIDYVNYEISNHQARELERQTRISEGQNHRRHR